MASSSASEAKTILDPPITESFCLLSPSSFPSLEATSDEIVLLQYPPTPWAETLDESDRVVDIIPGGGTISRSSTNQLLEAEEATGELNSAKYEVWPLDWNTAQECESRKMLWVEPKDSGDVQILYIPRLEQNVVEAAIGASCPNVQYPDLGGLLKPHNNTKPPLITGLRLRTTRRGSSGLGYLILFLGIPYLAGVPTDSEGSLALTLSQYHDFHNPGSKCSGIRVWQAWHILFDNNRIALFKSPDRPSTASPPSASNPPPTIRTLSAPLFPFQERLGAFHTLAQLMGNIFLHEDTVLHSFKERVNGEGKKLFADLERIKAAAIKNLDNQVKNSKKVRNSSKKDKNLSEEAKKFNEEVENFNEEVKKFDEQLTNLSVILKVIADQLKILKDFQRILDNNLPPGESYAARNAVRLPALDNQKEQISATLRVLKALATERTEKMTTLKEWQLELREMQKGWQMESQEIKKGQHTDASLDTAQEMKGILARQGQTVTMFTFITAAFLPLNFFATYLGMNTGVWSGVNTHEKFWRITGPITVVLVALLSYFIFRNDIGANLFKLGILNPAWWGSSDKSEGDGVEAAEGWVNGGDGLGGTGQPPAQLSTLGSSAGLEAVPELDTIGTSNEEGSNNPLAPGATESDTIRAN